MNSFLLFLTLLFLSQNYQCEGELIAETPQKFGIQTMTYTRSLLTNQMQTFFNYLNHYANLDCSCFDNIYIVWNNEQSPQQKGVKISNSWKKNVIFTKTPYNSLGWKYVIPESAPQKIFFTVDDDLYLNCDQLKKGFQNWKEHSIGELGPLVSYTKRSMVFQQKQQKFTYQPTYLNNYYTMSLMNCAFFSRQFTDLYYSDFQQIRGIRRVVQKKQNCQDIAMNFVASYFYPQIAPRIQQNTYQTTYTAGVSNAPDHFQKRNDCMNQFTQLMSFNPLRYFRLTFPQIQRLDSTCIILKKQEYYKKIIKHKTPEQIFEEDAIFNPNLSQHQIFQLEKKLTQKNQKQYKQKVEKKEEKNSQINIFIQKKMQNQQQNPQVFISTEAVQKMEDPTPKSQNLNQMQEKNQIKQPSKFQNQTKVSKIETKRQSITDQITEITNQKKTIQQQQVIISNQLKDILFVFVLALILAQCCVICVQRKKLKLKKKQTKVKQLSVEDQLEQQSNLDFNKSKEIKQPQNSTNLMSPRQKTEEQLQNQ